jgi:hypothetical protein
MTMRGAFTQHPCRTSLHRLSITDTHALLNATVLLLAAFAAVADCRPGE